MKNTAKKMGFFSVILLIINSVIGSGIFLSPGNVTTIAGKWAPFIYLFAGVFATILALTFASAAKYVNKNGAAYAYTKAAFGENAGFYMGVTRVLVVAIAWGAMATALVQTVLDIIGLPTYFINTTIGFLLLMGVLLLVNLFGMKILTFINNLSTLGKLLALGTVIVAGIAILLITGESRFNEIDTLTNSDGVLVSSTINLTTLVTAMIASFYAFTGFESVASGASDMKDPEKNLPKAIPIAMLIIIAIYFGSIFIAMMINPLALVESTAVVRLAAVFNNKIISSIITFGALVSMFGINVASSFSSPRVIEAMAKEKQIPQFFAKRTKRDFPLRAFLFTAIIAIIFPMVFSYNMGSIMTISVISRFVQFLIVPICVIIFYYGKAKEPILQPHKNILLDVILPAISVFIAIVLLVKYNWVGQFTSTTNNITSINWLAIAAMVLGYVILPALLFIYKYKNTSSAESHISKK